MTTECMACPWSAVCVSWAGSPPAANCARHTKRQIAAAVRRGEVRRPGRNRYVVPEVDDQRAFAHEHSAILGVLSAALARGWKVKWVPDKPWLVVTPGRKVGSDLRAQTAHISWAKVTEEERAEGITAPLRTVIDCARLPSRSTRPWPSRIRL